MDRTFSDDNTYTIDGPGDFHCCMDDGKTITGRVKDISIVVEREYETLYSETFANPVYNAPRVEQVSLSANFESGERGNYFTVTKYKPEAQRADDTGCGRYFVDLVDPSLAMLEYAMKQTGALDGTLFDVEVLDDGYYRFSWEV